MANIVNSQILVDTSKRTLIRFFINSDGTTANNSNVLLLNASSLRGALNTNGYIMTGNTNPKSNYRLSIKRAFGAAHANGFFRIKWQSDANSDIMIFPEGSFDYNFESMGDGAVIPQPTNEANVSGNILYGVHGAVVNDAFSLFLDLRKDNRDYDAGQTADPVAFNRGPAAP
jgi:hypothetical protein